MKGFFAALFIIIGVLLCSPGASAQSPMQPPPYGDYTVPKGANTSDIDTPTLYDLYRLREDRVVKKGPLAPAVSDRKALASFLRTKNTGLIRLLSREEKAELKAGTKKPRSIPGGGGFYSFTELSHAYPYVSDLSLAEGNLSIGSSGMLTRLGDIPLEGITVADPRTLFMSTYTPSRDSLETLNLEQPIVKSLAAYIPASEETNARTEYKRFATGESINGTEYKTYLPAVVNSSYVLRGIHYSDSDVLLTFRVVRKDTDGSIIIAWKILKKFPKPELARN